MEPIQTLYMNMSMHIFGAVICLTCYFFTFVNGRTNKYHNKLFLTLLSIVMVNDLTSIFEDWLTFHVDNDFYYSLLVLVTYAYFLFHSALSAVFLYYVSIVCGSDVAVKSKKFIFLSLPFVITEILLLLNPIFPNYFKFDENREFQRLWGESMLYVSAVFYVVIALGFLFHSWKALTERRKVALMFFAGLLAVGILTQFLYKDIKCELLAESFAVMGLMMSIETEDDRIDLDNGFYNRRAVQYDITSYIVNRRSFYTVCIKITNADIVQRATGSENTDLLSHTIAEFLNETVGRYNIYVTNPGTFLMTIMQGGEETALKIANILSERFEHPWQCGDANVLLNAVMMVASAPDRLTSANDVFYMTDCPIPSGNFKKILVGSDLDYLLRRAEVEKAVNRGLEAGSFEVYYQPTYHLSNQRLHGAEALIRMHDTVIGDVQPDEFVPIAEQIGMINEIDDFVLRNVCSFIRSGIPAANGVDCINVNLSVLQCLSPGFVEHINEIVEDYEIPKSSINFEITESVAASDYMLLSHVVSQLKGAGFKFSMDDYGTGYSNMLSIFSLDFDVIKIDKSILWSAERSEMGKIILENSVRMIRQMNRQILVEGVETLEQIKLLTRLSVDYLQGFYFSKPIPRSEFVELIERESARVGLPTKAPETEDK